MARVMVTGAAGFIGSHAVPILASHGHDIIAVARHAGAPRDNVRWAACDLLSDDAAAALVAMHRPTHVLHIAWTTTPGQFWTDLANLDWVAASLRLYRAFLRSGGRRFVGVGSCAEYDWSEALLSEAATPIRPGTLYGAAKAALGSVLASAATGEGVSFAWGRVFMLYGPREKRGRLVSDAIAALLDGREARVSHGTQERDVMHVADVAAAFVKLLESDVTGPVNIATGNCRPLADLIAAIGAAAGRPDLVRFGAVPAAPGEPRRVAAAIARLRDEVRFVPRFDLASGVADTYRWWRAEREGVGT